MATLNLVEGGNVCVRGNVPNLLAKPRQASFSAAKRYVFRNTTTRTIDAAR
jgi:hypothetical protein